MNLKKKLRRFFTLSRKANDGFTLVELIVVIAILAILGGVAVPAYNGYITKTNMTADLTLVGDIIRAVETYSYTVNAAPESSTGSVLGFVVVTDEGTVADGDMEKAMAMAFGEGYESAALKWDGWGNPTVALDNVSASIADSGFVLVGTDVLLEDVQHCVTSLGKFVSGKVHGNFAGGVELLDKYLGGGSYVADTLKDYDTSELDGNIVGNAVVFGLANKLNTEPADTETKMASGYYLLRNWEYAPGYNEADTLNKVMNSNSNLLVDLANTYASLEAFCAYMGYDLGLTFDPTDDQGKIVTDVQNKCAEVLNRAVSEGRAADMYAYIGLEPDGETPLEGTSQAQKDAEAYLSVMQTVSGLEDGYQDDYANDMLFDNKEMADRVNGYMAVSTLSADDRAAINAAVGDAESAVVIVLTVSYGGMVGTTVFNPAADPRY